MGKPRNLGEDVIALREAGLTYSQIMKRLKCAKNTVQYHCSKNHLTEMGEKMAPVSPEIAEEIREYLKTHSVQETATRFMYSSVTIRNHQLKSLERENH
jgi:DNA-binding CsgD family transcriptional regulator